MHASALQQASVGLSGGCWTPGSLLLSQLGIQLPDVCSASAEKCLRLIQLTCCKEGDTLLICMQANLPIMAETHNGCCYCFFDSLGSFTNVIYAVTYLGLYG